MATTPRPEPEKVTIQINWFPEPEFGGIYAAQQEGIFKKHGLDVEILKGGPDVPVVAMTAAGKVDFGVAAADEIITARDKDTDLVGIFATFPDRAAGHHGQEGPPGEGHPRIAQIGGHAHRPARPGLPGIL